MVKNSTLELQDFTLTVLFEQSPEAVYNAINNVRGWWSQEIEGKTDRLNEVFNYRYKDLHSSKIQVVELIPGKKVSWQVLDNYFNFTKDPNEWKGTKIVFDISRQGDKTKLKFTHLGLLPTDECYSACSGGWTQFVQQSLYNLVTKGKGQPNSRTTTLSTREVAGRFNQLAQEEMWFEIQNGFFADDIRSIEPAGSPWLENAEGKAAVRKKAEDWVKRIEAVHKAYTSEPVVGASHFAVSREMDLTVQGHGRVQMNQIMLYEVKDGKIVSEQFFY